MTVDTIKLVQQLGVVSCRGADFADCYEARKHGPHLIVDGAEANAKLAEFRAALEELARIGDGS